MLNPTNSKLRVQAYAILILSAVVSFTHERASAAPPSEPAISFTEVSDRIAVLAREHAAKGRQMESTGNYLGAVKEYEDAIAELQVYIGDSDVQNHNPEVYLARGGAEVDAARARMRLLGDNSVRIRRLLETADADFSSVLRIAASRPHTPQNQTVSLMQKASLGRGYARALAGNMETARPDLQSAGTTPGREMKPESSEIMKAVSGIDLELARAKQQRARKTAAVVNLGLKFVDAFFPKYSGLAVAVGEVADAFKK